jgi:hypothetical protein
MIAMRMAGEGVRVCVVRRAITRCHGLGPNKAVGRQE